MKAGYRVTCPEEGSGKLVVDRIAEDFEEVLGIVKAALKTGKTKILIVEEDRQIRDGLREDGANPNVDIEGNPGWRMVKQQSSVQYIPMNNQVIDPKIREAAGLVSQVYDFSAVGGNLHIVLDDGNVEDSHLDFCEKTIEENKNDLSPQALEVERKCLKAFRALDVMGRNSALKLAGH